MQKNVEEAEAEFQKNLEKTQEKCLQQKFWSPKIRKDSMMELDKLKEIIARELQHVKKEEITEDSRFVEDLNADSLDIVQIIMGIEEEFGIEIPEEASFQIKTVGEAHKAILKALGK